MHGKKKRQQEINEHVKKIEEEYERQIELEAELNALEN